MYIKGVINFLLHIKWTRLTFGLKHVPISDKNLNRNGLTTEPLLSVRNLNSSDFGATLYFIQTRLFGSDESANHGTKTDLVGPHGGGGKQHQVLRDEISYQKI